MRVALASYDRDEPADVQESQAAMGLDEVIAVLVCEFDWTQAQVEDRVADAVEIALEDKKLDG